MGFKKLFARPGRTRQLKGDATLPKGCQLA